jgi:hypothetical protein
MSYSRPATKFGLPQGNITWNPDFTATQDDKGVWTGSVTFTCNYSDIPRLLPELRSPCQEAGWNFMQLVGITVNNNEGDTGTVSCKYSGTVSPDYEFGDEEDPDITTLTDSSNMSSTVEETPIEQHPKYKDVTDKDKQLMQELKNGRFKRAEVQPEDARLFETRVDDEGVEQIEFTDELAIELADFISSGVLTYLNATPIYTYTYPSPKQPTASVLNKVGKIEPNPKGAPSVTEGRNWLMTALNFDYDGVIYTISGEFRLSGKGGWDERIYGTSS